MADRAGHSRELVFCHECENEWHRHEHGLQCPQCHSEFVEVIEAGHDPRDDRNDEGGRDSAETNPDRLSPHPIRTPSPFDTHNPWAAGGSTDDDGGGVTHVEWNAGPGLHFSRTSYRSTSPNVRLRQGINDPFAPFFQSFSAMLAGGGPLQQQDVDRDSGRIQPFNPSLFHRHFQHGSAPTSPLQEGHARPGLARGGFAMQASPRLAPRDADSAQPYASQVDNLHELLGTLIRGMQEIHGGPGVPNHNSGAPTFPPLQFFAQFLNPANARHGDAVYSEEALDRIISQFMEAQNGHTAPGPASAEAIAQLPKKKADESILGPEGKAECSVCMDNVEVGDEVTVLPCSHWFHGDCVGEWLKEHDTCPHCRQGIMPKDPQQGSDAPRHPGQEPRHSQPPMSPPDGNSGFHLEWHAGPVHASPSARPQSPPSAWSRHESRSRRRSAARESSRSSGDGAGGGSGGGGGLTGWMRSHFGGGSNNHE